MELAATFLAGVVLTLLGTYFLYRFQRTRKRLGYQVISAERLVAFKPKPKDPLQIMVRGDLMGDNREYVPVGTVWGFRVRIRNCGSIPIEDQALFMELDQKAKVITGDVEPSDVTHTRTIIVDPRLDNPNRVRVKLPFLNPKEEVTVAVQSVENSGAECRVIAGAPGLEAYDMGRRVERLRQVFGSLIFVFFGVSIGFLQTPMKDLLGVSSTVQLLLAAPFFAAGFGLAISRGRIAYRLR